MIVRDAAPMLRPGAYMIGVGPVAASLSYRELQRLLCKALKDLETV